MVREVSFEMTLVPNSEGVSCWGRNDDLDHLATSVWTQRKSGTLVYGDSGIGKTTLLKALVQRLRSSPDVIIGLCEAVEGDSDPLLRCLNALLKSVYTLDNVGKQIEIACRNARISVSGMRKFLTKALSAFGDAPGVGLFAKAALSTLDIVADSVLSLELKLEPGLQPRLEICNFRDIVGILQSAFSDKRFVFVIDNLNAPVESLTSAKHGLSSIDTIVTYLTQDFRHAAAVHLFFSWKRNLRNVSTLSDFEEKLVEYGGAIYYLEPLKSIDAVRASMQHDFRWFKHLPQSEQDAVAHLTGGLPEVVTQWRENEIREYDHSKLAKLADDVK